MPSQVRRAAKENGKLAPRAGGIIEILRKEITSGRLAPAEKLGTWDEMGRRFNVGRPTLVRVMDRLKQDGLVVADSTRGTYVAERPPHLHRIALVFSEGPGQVGWNRLWAGLTADAQVVANDLGKEIVHYHWALPHADNESYRQLHHEARAGRLAGVVAVGGGPMVDPEVIESLGVPVVAMQSPPLPKTAPVVYVDYESFSEQALRWLAARGRRRPAILTNVHYAQAGIFDRLPEFGMSAKPGWLQAADTNHAWWAGQIVRLLLDLPIGPDRPDSLIVTDDNLAEPALQAIVAMGVKVPAELDIVTHCNFTAPITPVVPMLRLGFDSREMLKLAFETISQLRAQQEVPPLQVVPAVELPDSFMSRRPMWAPAPLYSSRPGDTDGQTLSLAENNPSNES